MCATSMGILLLGLLAFLGLGFFVPVSMETSYETPQPVEPTAIVASDAPSARWRELSVIDGDCGDIFSVDWSPDGSRLVGGCNDGTARIWDAGTGELLQTLEGHTAQVWTVDWSPDGIWIASGSEDGTTRIWHADSGFLTWKSKPIGWVSAVEWSAGSWQPLASAHSDGVIRIWNGYGYGLISELRGHEYTVNDVSWLYDGERLVSGGGSGYPDNTVRMWHEFYNQQLHIFWGHGGEVWTVAASPDGTRIASGSSDHTVRIWRVHDGSVMFIFEGHTGVVNSVAWSPSGQYLVSASSDGTLRTWDMATGGPLDVIETPHGWISSVAWSADGRIASAGADGTIRVWGE